eukprot:TRINITY_DN14498_c1_g2_i2.p1 TRINITY_DN14498_c1_g2~~TRINITY_DN14498_c1_g2_i2.p1  ORF type:complete len:296 (+),score=78.67 TRINITY_DN14498_c1_g2_i2:44-889(+)
MTTPAAPISRVIRFLSEGQVYLGEEPANKSDREAEVLEGDIHQGLTRTGTTRPVERNLAPLIPREILCIGLNYMKHFEEATKGQIPLPDKPTVFMKSLSSLNDPESPVWMPQLEHGQSLDYEVELAFVIGKICKNVKKEDALKYVLGYMVSNDVTSRHWQKNAGAGQWVKGKSFDTFSPMGPSLVMASAIPDPQALKVTTRVNGETRQDSNTKDMIFTVAEIIEWLSTDMTLHPGTVVMTGTPEGVAMGMDPPKWLQVGDVVECEVESLGTLRNFVTTPPL